MKQSKLISMIGALVVMISAVVCITACPGANNLKNNPEDSFEIKPTGEADAKLKDSLWSNEDRDVAIFFLEKGILHL